MPKVRVNDIDLNYEAQGEGEPLVLVHGLGSSLRDWDLQVDHLAQGYRVIRLDLRGHGESDKPRQRYQMALFAQDVAEFLRSLDAVPAHLVGFSLGGMVAFQMAADYPELVKSMVVVNSGPYKVVNSLADRWMALQRILVVRLVGMRKMGEVLAPRMFPKEEQAQIREQFVERWAENDKAAYLSSLKAILDWNGVTDLGSLRIPTLVVSADQDYTPVEAKAAYVAQMPAARLVVISDSHHATPVDQPEKLNAAIDEFLRNRENYGGDLP